jgi:autotransporter-associated beta strand protein
LIKPTASPVRRKRAAPRDGNEVTEHLEGATMRPQASHSSHQTDTGRAAPRRALLRAILLATSALASAALPTTVAHAGSATWKTQSIDGNFNNGDNWFGGVVPDGGTATVGSTNQDEITFNQLTNLATLSLLDNTRAYTFTNRSTLTFTGAGIVFQDGVAASITNTNLSNLNFSGSSSAGRATISNDDGGTITFRNSSQVGAGHAEITNNSGGKLLFAVNASAEAATIHNFSGGAEGFKFDNSSTAADATIRNHGDLHFVGESTAGNANIVSFITPSGSESKIFIEENASGGTARFQLSNGSLDISNLLTAGTTVGSIEGSGNVFLGTKNLSVVGNNTETIFSGVIQDDTAAPLLGGGGSLTKEGTGTLILTGANTYTGTTTVSGGALVVDGSIASDVIVNAGGTLAGTGTVGSTEIKVGGTLAPGHSDGSFGQLRIQGDLLFNQGAGTTSTYLVQVSPANATSTAPATSTSVTGTATLNGATVKANFAPGTYVKNEYTILTAGTVDGQFGSLVPTNLSPMFKATLSYDAEHKNVFLDLDADANAAAGLNTNQRNVFNAIANSRNLMGGLPVAFMTLTPAGYTQIAGETAVGTQQATFDAMNQFMGVLLDPTVGALSGGRTKDAFAAMPRKAPLAAEAFNARWGVWAAGFGGSQSISGDAVLGSNKTTSNVFGSAAGAEYRFSPNTVAGFALAGGGTNFRVANGGSGNSDLFQAGAYLRHTQGAAFLAAALAYGWQDVTTNRTVTVAGIDNLRGRFNANAISGRLEGGYKVATQAGEFTPYAAGQFTSYRLPSYTEQVASGANTFALAYNGKDVTATRSELGLRSEKAVALTDATLMLRGRLAWAHDFNTDRNVQAAFLTLPGSAFVVNGAQPAADTALTTASAEMLWRNGWSAAVTADAQLSDTTHSYSGKGVVRYNW